MDRYKCLYNNFYSLDLYYGKTNFKIDHIINSFFIVEHPCSDEFIHDQSLALLTSHCRCLDFYGAYSEKWNTGFDLVKKKLRPQNDGEILALTKVWESFDEFAEEIFMVVNARPIVPYQTYLIYDDKEIYEKVIDRLKQRMSINM